MKLFFSVSIYTVKTVLLGLIWNTFPHDIVWERGYQWYTKMYVFDNHDKGPTFIIDWEYGSVDICFTRHKYHCTTFLQKHLQRAKVNEKKCKSVIILHLIWPPFRKVRVVWENLNFCTLVYPRVYLCQIWN